MWNYRVVSGNRVLTRFSVKCTRKESLKRAIANTIRHVCDGNYYKKYRTSVRPDGTCVIRDRYTGAIAMTAGKE